MKEIKDYLHLYLGCDAIITYVRDAEFEKTLDPRHWAAVGNEIVMDASMLFYLTEGWINVKPILRPLSDMTEEEIIEMHDHFYPDYQHYSNEHKLDFMALDTCEKKYTPELMVWFLKLGVDIFQLHEQGLCLYKSDLK